MFKSIRFGVLLILIYAAGSHGQFAPNEPTSAEAGEAMKRHDDTIFKAATVYWRACKSADQTLLGDLNAAKRVAERSDEGAEASKIQKVIDDVTQRLQMEDKAIVDGVPPAPLAPYSFQKPIDDEASPEIKAAVAAGKPLKGMTETQLEHALKNRKLDAFHKFERRQRQSSADGTVVVDWVVMRSGDSDGPGTVAVNQQFIPGPRVVQQEIEARFDPSGHLVDFSETEK